MLGVYAVVEGLAPLELHPFPFSRPNCLELACDDVHSRGVRGSILSDARCFYCLIIDETHKGSNHAGNRDICCLVQGDREYVSFCFIVVTFGLKETVLFTLRFWRGKGRGGAGVSEDRESGYSARLFVYACTLRPCALSYTMPANWQPHYTDRVNHQVYWTWSLHWIQAK